eukprot:3470341-Amphidinium_carterae.1
MLSRACLSIYTVRTYPSLSPWLRTPLNLATRCRVPFGCAMSLSVPPFAQIVLAACADLTCMKSCTVRLAAGKATCSLARIVRDKLALSRLHGLSLLESQRWRHRHMRFAFCSVVSEPAPQERAHAQTHAETD